MDNITPLLSGIDSLVISIDAAWKSHAILKQLHGDKAAAQALQTEVPVFIREPEGTKISFMLKPFGTGGYTWLLVGKDYTLKLMDWDYPKSRPNIIVEIRSELLWHLGPREAINRIVRALEHNGAQILIIKPSRADLCKDLLVPASEWNLSILDYVVTKANLETIRREHRQLNSITYGQKKVLCRIYDKTKEIESSSGKTWFYDLWGLKRLTEDMKVIRVEFQFRREPLREFGCDDIQNFFNALAHIWTYSTTTWLKFQTNPGAHHSKRKTLPWWEIVQAPFMGICGGEPLIRAKAIEDDKKRLRQQATGLCSSIIALDRDTTGETRLVGPEDYLRTIHFAIQRLEKSEMELHEAVITKQHKRARLRKKMDNAQKQRIRLGITEKPRGLKNES